MPSWSQNPFQKRLRANSWTLRQPSESGQWILGGEEKPHVGFKSFSFLKTFVWNSQIMTIQVLSSYGCGSTLGLVGRWKERIWTFQTSWLEEMTMAIFSLPRNDYNGNILSCWAPYHFTWFYWAQLYHFSGFFKFLEKNYSSKLVRGVMPVLISCIDL